MKTPHLIFIWSYYIGSFAPALELIVSDGYYVLQLYPFNYREINKINTKIKIVLPYIGMVPTQDNKLESR